MSDKVTVEEMVEWIDREISDLGSNPRIYHLKMLKAIRALIEHGPEVDADWLIAKANAVLYAMRRRFHSRITTRDTAMMRDLLADVVMAAGVKVKEGGA